MSHSNRDVAHDFYYHGVDDGKTGRYSKCSISYCGKVACSYSTAVAMVIPAKGFRDSDVTTRRPSTGITLVSLYSMSNTTGRHISYLARASPFRVAIVPMRYGHSDFTPQDMAMQFLMQLTEYADGLNVAENRSSFVRLIDTLKELRETACEAWAKPLRDRRFRKFLAMDVHKIADEIKARNRKAAAKRASETRALYAKYLKNVSGERYCKFMRTLFEDSYECPEFPFDWYRRRQLRSRLDKDAAYVWINGDQIRTSMRVSVPVDEARVLLKAWAAGKDMRMMRVSRYTILAYEGDVIKIGCHRIPRANMLALYEAVIGEPFPKKPIKTCQDKEET